MKLIPLKGGDEYDGLTGAKRFYRWRPGARKAIKRQFNKRLRRYFKARASELRRDA